MNANIKPILEPEYSLLIPRESKLKAKAGLAMSPTPRRQMTAEPMRAKSSLLPRSKPAPKGARRLITVASPSDRYRRESSEISLANKRLVKFPEKHSTYNKIQMRRKFHLALESLTDIRADGFSVEVRGGARL